MRLGTCGQWPARWVLSCLSLALLTAPVPASAAPLSATARSRLGSGQTIRVLVEFDTKNVDAAAATERSRRHLHKDDKAILALRTKGYLSVKSSVEAAAAAADAAKVRDYDHLPLALWRLSSLDALRRLEALPSVRMVHEDIQLHAVSVSDLPFINQPQTAAEGATGAGTTIAVIDGGLGTNYQSYSDFGTCTGIGTPASTCRVVYDKEYYPGASSEVTHGTNVSAIALGVASGAKLAMFNVFNGTGASSSDITDAIDIAISNQATYNIVAINMSLGDGSSNSAQCNTSVFAPAIAAALDAGIQSVIAAGNNGSKSGLANPACVPGVISVGAVYDASYGTASWAGVTADPGGTCSDATAADKVTCFSQSASYLSLLAPGTFVNAPSSAFQESGTSQATPHVSGAVAVLRARYPAESLGEILQRLQITGVRDTDSAAGLTFSRLNLLAATNQGTALALSGTGPVTAVSGTTSTYTLTVTNSGPLTATNVLVKDVLPSGATIQSISSGCAVNSPDVTCAVASLGSGATVTLTITVTWSFNGPVYDTAAVSADQANTSSQNALAFGVAPTQQTDAPLPEWAYVLLGLALFALGSRRLRGGTARSVQPL